MKKTFFILLLSLLFITSTFTGCTGNMETAGRAEQDKPMIAVSIAPEITFVKAVAGDLVDVTLMIPPGYSPANYAPSPQEIASVSNAKIYFSIGVPAETNILPDFKELNPDMKIVDLAAASAAVYPEREFTPGNRDPHIWLSPKRAQVMVKTIADELCQIDLKNGATYTANALEFVQKLENLDSYINTSLAEAENKAFIVYHPAFGYFADDYNLEMIPIELEGKEATPERLKEIIDFAGSRNIKVVFYQAEIDSRQADTIAAEIGGKTEQVDPLSSEYIDNLKKIADTFAQTAK